MNCSKKLMVETREMFFEEIFKINHSLRARLHCERITELGFNFLNKIIVFFVDSHVQKSIFGLFCQCLYSYQNKGPRGARVQNYSTATHRYFTNLQKAIFLGLG